MEGLKRIILGIEHSPQVVAAVRSLALYGLPILVTLIVGYLSAITDPRFYGLALLCVPLVRALGEGVIDSLKPSQNDAQPTAVAGGADPDVLN